MHAASARFSPEGGVETVARLLLSVRPTPAEEGCLLRRIRVLHTLRSMLGTVVESLLLIDRLLFVCEAIPDNSDLSVKLINIFDQGKGSGRNVALVFEPKVSTT